MDERIAEICERAIQEKVFPGGVVGYIRGDTVNALPFGRLTYAANAPAVTSETVYDVASVTKSVPTGSVILKLIEEGRLGLDDQVIAYIPELRNDYREHILIRHLLTYTVIFDFPGGLAKVAREAPSRLLERIFAAPLVTPPGARYYYTNAPAILLGLIAERVCGQSLDLIARRLFFEPLGMLATTFWPDFSDRQIAPTERDWRDEVQGQAHDEAAWVLTKTGMTPGHAGLFSTASDLLTFAQMLLCGGAWHRRQILDPQTIVRMHTNQIAKLGASTGLGWELNQPHVMGSAASDQCFGKTGFTGCLILVDPVRKAALVHLSNRTYPDRSSTREAINTVRRALADVVLAT